MPRLQQLKELQPAAREIYWELRRDRRPCAAQEGQSTVTAGARCHTGTAGPPVSPRGPASAELYLHASRSRGVFLTLRGAKALLHPREARTAQQGKKGSAKLISPPPHNELQPEPTTPMCVRACVCVRAKATAKAATAEGNRREAAMLTWTGPMLLFLPPGMPSSLIAERKQRAS